MGVAEAAAAAAMVAIVAMYLKRMQQDVAFVRSRVDGNEYLVLKRADADAAADTLARLHAKVVRLLAGMERSLRRGGGAPSEDEDAPARLSARAAARLARNVRERYRRSALSEGGTEEGFTSYSVNKGERIVMCLRERDAQGVLGDIEDDNTLAYVLLHEIAHLGTDEVGHTPAFWNNFRHILDAAEAAGVYSKVDYGARPEGYCGIQITSSASFPRRGSHGTAARAAARKTGG